MSFFTRLLIDQLYVGPSGVGFLYLVLPDGVPSPGPGIELTQALTDASLGATFVYAPVEPRLDASTAGDFVSSVLNVVSQASASRGIVWLRDAEQITPSTAPVLGLTPNGLGVSTGLSTAAQIFPGLGVQVPGGMTIDQNGTVITLSNGSVGFTGVSTASTQAGATLDFDGPQRCAFQFSLYIQRASLQSAFNWGFQVLFPAKDTNLQPAVAALLPLADGAAPSPTDAIGFAVSLDPSDPLNGYGFADRTALAFTGQNLDGTATSLVSYFRTAYGAAVRLLPVGGRLVFNAGLTRSDNTQQFQLAPEGDFALQVDGGKDGTRYELICGLQGTEYLAFNSKTDTYSGDLLRFTSRQPAYASHYPFAPVSPVGPPIDPKAPLLDDGYLTSWVTVVPGDTQSTGTPYVAQPKGASLYGRDALIYQGYDTLFGPRDPAILLPPVNPPSFPMLPYAGAQCGDGTTAFSASQLEDFEEQIVGPTRRGAIGQHAVVPGGTKPPVPPRGGGDEPENITTPIGVIVGNDGGTWQKIILGQNLNPVSGAPSPQVMYFSYPDTDLQQAFQTNQLFLVVANADHLGMLVGAGPGPASPTDPAFYNTMSVGSWQFRADVGQNQYADYRNVMIVKGRRGALYDATNDATKAQSLISNPDQWTQRDAFGVPSDLKPGATGPDALSNDRSPAELIVLSQWLREYFQDAFDQPDSDYFQKFITIAQDPNWTGILFLRMSIETLPTDLAGITAGISEPTRFNAHHFAIDISQVQNNPGAPRIDLRETSSMFGLIYYVDPSYNPLTPGQPVLPPSGVDYDFKVLTLKVLFENSAVKSFQSYAQLTLNRLLSMPVAQMGDGGNPYNTIVLAGSYQQNNGQPVYSLTSVTDSTFLFNSNVINRIDVTDVQMSVRNPGNPTANADVVSLFSLSGFIDFAVVKDTDGNLFDILSFGNLDGETKPRQGLSYANLGLVMTFPTNQPYLRQLTLDSSQISFDPGASTPRPGSLYISFALNLKGLQTGASDATPASSGYLPVITSARLSGVDGSPWYGLSYRLNLGTPGALAGDVGLTSTLLTAWAPDSSGANGYKALVGLELPGTGGGAKLISLQTVLKLSIGQIRLILATSSDGKTKSFLLMLTEIALKILGFLKVPPGGSTLFYLFGNPQSGGKPSGLGWYAMYNRENVKQTRTTVLAANDAPMLAAPDTAGTSRS